LCLSSFRPCECQNYTMEQNTTTSSCSLVKIHR
jgi:hypothetical protein